MLCGVFLADGTCIVRRCIFANDNLIGHMTFLHQYGVDSPADGVLLVVGEDDD